MVLPHLKIHNNSMLLVVSIWAPLLVFEEHDGSILPAHSDWPCSLLHAFHQGLMSSDNHFT